MTETQLDRLIAIIATLATIVSALLMCKQTLDQRSSQVGTSQIICTTK